MVWNKAEEDAENVFLSCRGDVDTAFDRMR